MIKSTTNVTKYACESLNMKLLWIMHIYRNIGWNAREIYGWMNVKCPAKLRYMDRLETRSPTTKFWHLINRSMTLVVIWYISKLKKLNVVLILKKKNVRRRIGDKDPKKIVQRAKIGHIKLTTERVYELTK